MACPGAARRRGYAGFAVGALTVAVLLFAAAPADAGLLRNAPGVGAAGLAHRSLSKNLVGGLTGALDRAFRGALSDDSQEVDAALGDAKHAIGKTARDMIPGAWLFDTVGKRLKTAVENVREFLGDTRAALDPFGQAEAEVLDGDPLSRPELPPPTSQGGDAWDAVMNERTAPAVRTDGDAWDEVMNERAGAAPRAGRGDEARRGRQRGHGGGDAWDEVMNEQTGADTRVDGSDGARLGPGAGAAGDAWDEVMNERAVLGQRAGGENPMGGNARDATIDERAEANPERRVGGDGTADQTEERRAPPPHDIDPSSRSYSCEETGPLVEKALKEIEDRGKGGSTVTTYCASANVGRATLWGMLQCLNDPNLGSDVGASAADVSGARRALRENVSRLRQHIAQSLEGVRALSDGDGGCGCWSEICAN